MDGGGGDGGGGGGDFASSTPAADVPAASSDSAPATQDASPATSSADIVPVVVATQEAKKDPRSLLTKALDALQVGKRKKLEKVVALAQKKGRISNDDVQKALRVSDATATRYLSQLVKEGRLKSSGVRAGMIYEPV
ncbi:MAG: winged helix-turn-helix transcriptional regulator [Candidatus Pacebacteria bacterium]|nr:winged helix-turn-helix transcriptional regulator [Candidatus Paceibacterota bacterium]